MRLPTLPRPCGPLRRRKHGDRRGAARPRQRRGPELLAALPLRPAVSVAGPQRACGPLRSHGDRAAWARRGAATDRWSRRVARARGDLRGRRARGGVRLVTSRVPHHARIAAALRSLGADATLAPYQPPPSSRVDQPTPCFATPVGGEVLVAGRKLVGSAQVRKGNAFLQHGSILLDGSQEIIAAVSSAPHVAGTETTLTAALDRPVSFEEVAEAVIEAFGDVGAQHAAPLPSDSPTVRPTVFQDPDGTWRR